MFFMAPSNPFSPSQPLLSQFPHGFSLIPPVCPRTVCKHGEPINFTKPELRAAADGLDDWFDGQTAAIAQALPPVFRQKATPKQMSRLLRAVILRRFERDKRDG